MITAWSYRESWRKVWRRLQGATRQADKDKYDDRNADDAVGGIPDNGQISNTGEFHGLFVWDHS